MSAPICICGHDGNAHPVQHHGFKSWPCTECDCDRFIRRVAEPATDDTEATEVRMVTLTLNVEEAAEVHGLADSAAADYRRMARKMDMVPALARFFHKGADLCAGIADRIEDEFPEFGELAERYK